VGTGIFRELDYHLEAENARDFSATHAFLGFVRVPQWEPRYTGPKGRARVLALEWVDGKVQI
jgi:predicted unusual protein kinase regulating ubiquinone biosynthesis (AarF/ABC1/UbiB family)